MLTDLCPFFLKIKLVGRQEWLEMPQGIAVPPSVAATYPSPSPQSSPSGGSSALRARRAVTPTRSLPKEAETELGLNQDQDQDEPFIPINRPPMSPTPASRSSNNIPSSPCSPSPRSGRAMHLAMGIGMGAGVNGSLAGPGSPGKVKFGGLREVRERIRRELGE
jgi:hypothetical protein